MPAGIGVHPWFPLTPRARMTAATPLVWLVDEEYMPTGRQAPPPRLDFTHGLAFAGSNVVYGQGRGVVVATGARTEAGRIADLMAGTRRLQTPLTERIGRLSKLLVWVILGVSACLFVYEALLGRARACEAARGRRPTVIAVDFYRTGALFQVARALNGLPDPLVR